MCNDGVVEFIGLKQGSRSVKIIQALLLVAALTGCVHQPSMKEVTIYTFIYPPYTDEGPSGLFIDLISAAYESQNVRVNFEFDTLANSVKKAKAMNGIMLASRRYQTEYAQEIGFEEFYDVNTYIISIQGRPKASKMGAFSGDEVAFAKKNGLIPIKYEKPSDGMKLLYEDKVSSLICTDISCDQIKLTNPDVQFAMEPGYSFPVDLVYFGKEPSTKVKTSIAILQSGIKTLLESGKYLEIQNSYKVSNSVYQIPLEGLTHLKIN